MPASPAEPMLDAKAKRAAQSPEPPAKELQ